MNSKNHFIKNIIMFILGCSFYVLLEILFRDRSYRLMALAGGISWCFGGTLNNRFSWKMDLLLQCSCISAIVTFLELVIGNIDYYFLHLNMWDYSNQILNFANGKICLLFSILWFFIGFPIIFIYDAIIYYWMHDGDQPRYYIFGKEIWRMPKRNCH